MRISKILFPTDFSKNSEAPLAYVKELAGRCRCTIIVLHAIERLEELSHFPLPMKALQELKKERRRLAMAGLKKFVREKFGHSRRIVLEVAEGPPYQAIVEVAKKRRPSLIIMGTHGRGVLAGFLLGSNAERVVKTAPCPVLTVKGNHHGERDR